MGQNIQSLNGGFMPETRTANYRFSSMFDPPQSNHLNMRSSSEGCEENQTEQIIEILWWTWEKNQLKK